MSAGLEAHGVRGFPPSPDPPSRKVKGGGVSAGTPEGIRTLCLTTFRLGWGGGGRVATGIYNTVGE